MMPTMKTSACASPIVLAAAGLLIGCASHPNAPVPVARNAVAAPTAPPAASPPAANAAGYSAETTPIGTLLDNPATRAILNKYIPGFSSTPGVEMGRGMTLKAAQPYAPSTLSNPVLAKIDAALAKVPTVEQ